MRVLPEQCTENETATMLTDEDLHQIIIWAEYVEHHEYQNWTAEEENLKGLLLGVKAHRKLVAPPDRRIADVLADDFVQSVARS